VILNGKDLDINNLMMQLELKNKSINVHPIGHKKVSEHRIVAKHGAKVEKNYKVWKYLEQISAYF
jgi:hypothetical protein